MIVKCERCGKDFDKPTYRVKRRKRHYCSRKCYSPKREADIEGNISYIKLTKGSIAIVDQIDGDLAGYNWRLSSQGYAVRTNGKRRLCMHREIVERKIGRKLEPDEFVDHIDRDRLNNVRSNLRIADPRHQSMNKSKSKTYRGKPTSSIYKGVSFCRRTGKWQSSIQVDHESFHLGTFDNEIEAAEIYDIYALRLFGEYAHVNFPEADYVKEIKKSKAEYAVAATATA